MQKWEERVYDRLDGIEEGKASINQLNQALLRDNRLDDLVRSATDPDFQKALLREYNISA